MKDGKTGGFIMRSTLGKLPAEKETTSSLCRAVGVPHLSPPNAVLQRENSALLYVQMAPACSA